jgi:hypothetical protein
MICGYSSAIVCCVLGPYSEVEWLCASSSINRCESDRARRKKITFMIGYEEGEALKIASEHSRCLKNNFRMAAW